ncbi:HVSL domain-containing protein [Aspergillus chevalieri]|uniref:U6 snRNA phosphodiesterase n=1 Tax=Aspergillus chevalieri TaxID=182096 RepID=A0A7R7VTV9_ASPCH|nr:poly(U)-specific 3'-to-5' RNA exonuclease [Aspergillus chevalieri]BCR90717.1 poly(U)-specific 3'-to-5' RNA exonuclease [Aspergillus chevalieri]
MSLVQYSDSESDSDTQTSPPPPAKRIRPNTQCQRPNNPGSSLPPLPTTFYDLYATSTRVSVQDDPSLHGGRKRVIPHVEGNWPTHLYLEWFPSKSELGVLENLIQQSESKLGDKRRVIHSLLRSDLGAQLPLHISLSRPVVLRTEQRQSFIDTYTTAVRDSNVSPFDITPGNLHWVSNYEKTRWFLVLHAQKPANDGLNCLLKLSNRLLASFDQPPLYEKAIQTNSGGGRRQQNGADDHSHCFHISIAWALTEPSTVDREQVASIDLKGLKGLRVRFDCVKAKIGNNISSIPLPSGIVDQKGIGGL